MKGGCFPFVPLCSRVGRESPWHDSRGRLPQVLPFPKQGLPPVPVMFLPLLHCWSSPRAQLSPQPQLKEESKKAERNWAMCFPVPKLVCLPGSSSPKTPSPPYRLLTSASSSVVVVTSLFFQAVTLFNNFRGGLEVGRERESLRHILNQEGSENKSLLNFLF